MIQMPDVHDVGLDLVQDRREGIIHRRVAETVTRPSHVDNVKSDSSICWVGLLMNGVFREEGVLLPGEHMHLVAFGERLGQALGIHFGAGVVPHGVAVDYLQDFHWTLSWLGKRGVAFVSARAGNRLTVEECGVLIMGVKIGIWTPPIPHGI